MAGDITFLARLNDEVDRSTYTFAATTLGAEAADRIILAGIGSTRGGGGGAVGNVTGVTIGGVTAEFAGRLANPDGGAGALTLEAWAAEVPTGTTGDVVVNYGSAQARCDASLFRVIGCDFDSIAFVSDPDDPGSLSLPVTEDGVAAGWCYSNDNTDISWSGGLTEDNETATPIRLSSASAETGSTTTLSIVADATGTVSKLAAAAVALSPATAGLSIPVARHHYAMMQRR